METQVDETFFSGIKEELVSMEECRNQTRDKMLGRKLYVGRISTVEMYRG